MYHIRRGVERGGGLHVGGGVEPLRDGEGSTSGGNHSVRFMAGAVVPYGGASTSAFDRLAEKKYVAGTLCVVSGNAEGTGTLKSALVEALLCEGGMWHLLFFSLGTVRWCSSLGFQVR